PIGGRVVRRDPELHGTGDGRHVDTGAGVASVDAHAREIGDMFASRTVVNHLMRGGIAGSLIAWAIVHQSSDPVFTLLAIVLAVVAMRGCPLCWTIGLVETIANRLRPFIG